VLVTFGSELWQKCDLAQMHVEGVQLGSNIVLNFSLEFAEAASKV